MVRHNEEKCKADGNQRDFQEPLPRGRLLTTVPEHDGDPTDVWVSSAAGLCNEPFIRLLWFAANWA